MDLISEPLRTIPASKRFLNMIVVVGFAIDGYHAGSLRHRAILAPGYSASNFRAHFTDRPAQFLRCHGPSDESQYNEEALRMTLSFLSIARLGEFGNNSHA